MSSTPAFINDFTDIPAERDVVAALSNHPELLSRGLLSESAFTDHSLRNAFRSLLTTAPTCGKSSEFPQVAKEIADAVRRLTDLERRRILRSLMFDAAQALYDAASEPATIALQLR